MRKLSGHTEIGVIHVRPLHGRWNFQRHLSKLVDSHLMHDLFLTIRTAATQHFAAPVSGACLDWDMARDNLRQVELPAGVVDVDAD